METKAFGDKHFKRGGGGPGLTIYWLAYPDNFFTGAAAAVAAAALDAPTILTVHVVVFFTSPFSYAAQLPAQPRRRCYLCASAPATEGRRATAPHLPPGGENVKGTRRMISPTPPFPHPQHPGQYQPAQIQISEFTSLLAPGASFKRVWRFDGGSICAVSRSWQLCARQDRCPFNF